MKQVVLLLTQDIVVFDIVNLWQSLNIFWKEQPICNENAIFWNNQLIFYWNIMKPNNNETKCIDLKKTLNN